MPNIKEFDAPDAKLNPTSLGTDSRSGTARRVGSIFGGQASAEETLARETSRLASDTGKLASETSHLGAEKGAALTQLGHQIGSDIEVAGTAAVKYLDHQQISQGSKAYGQLLEGATKAWQATAKNADPNDPGVAKRFMDGLETQLTTFKDEGFYTENGQKWAEAHVEALRTHMRETTTSTMATLAGQAVQQNLQQTINSLSSAVHTDPTSLDLSLASLKSSTEGLISTSPNMTVEAAGRARTDILQKGAEAIVKSAAIGFIEKTGKMPAWASDPKYAPYINGAELTMFEKQAKAQAKVDTLTAKQTELAQRQLNERKAESASNKALTDNVSIDQTSGRPVVNPQFFRSALEIAKMPDAPQGLARTMIDWAESQQNKDRKIIDDPAVRQGLTDRLFDPTNPTTRQDLMKAQIAGKLSDHSFQAMERLVTELEQSPLKGPVYQDTMKAAHDQLVVNVPGIPGKDTVGTQAYSSFVQKFVPEYLAKSRNGTLPPNALDTKDPSSMISQAMAPFKRTPAQRMSDYVAGAGGLGGGEPPKPAPAIAPPTKVSTPADAGKLAPSTRYQTPDGKVYVR